MRSAGNIQKGTIKLDGKSVDYAVRLAAGVKHRRIRVTPAGIEVVIPRDSELGNAAAFLRENEGWVLAQLDFVERASGIIRDTRQPSSFLLRGEERAIRIIEEQTTRRYGIVAEERDTLTIRVPIGKPGLAARALELWLRHLARADLHRALDRRAREMKLVFGRVYIMSQRTRWGGCSSRRNLSFNWRLIMAPPDVLDYLAVHELAHLAEPNHTIKFWLIVRSFCPDFDRHKSWLRENEWRLKIPAV